LGVSLTSKKSLHENSIKAIKGNIIFIVFIFISN